MTDKSMVSFRLDDDRLAQIDERAKALGINRTQWFDRMTRWVLDNTYTKDKDTGARIQRAENTP